MSSRYYPISESFFDSEIKPIILSHQIWKGRPPKISHYQAFCAILYVLRTGIPWRDLPPIFGDWDAIYKRFSRGNDRGLWWKILLVLQRKKRCELRIALTDSTTFKVHRHGGGLKGGSKVRASAAEA